MAERKIRAAGKGLVKSSAVSNSGIPGNGLMEVQVAVGLRRGSVPGGTVAKQSE